MIIAIDVHYRADFAKVVSIEFENWKDSTPAAIHELKVTEVEDYISGAFYKRELPCILKILEAFPQKYIEAIIVDGYVVLDDQGKAGLGQYLYEALEEKIPVIGVAKRGFLNNEKNVIQVKRGESNNPLFITSAGIDLKETAQKIKNMAGAYRIPELLKVLDRATKA